VSQGEIGKYAMLDRVPARALVAEVGSWARGLARDDLVTTTCALIRVIDRHYIGSLLVFNYPLGKNKSAAISLSDSPLAKSSTIIFCLSGSVLGMTAPPV
jgi:hypothetical protein